mmetsp:Transcript_15811/g.23934  ORF Transcript_15811/g.23934 Transcript_15811/m.23934 type:complete len:87 (+) Transcript_15811:1050-1310(+)
MREMNLWLQRLSKQPSYWHGERVMVAVIGAGHCNGIIEKLLDTKPSPQPEEILPSITRTKRKAEDDFEGSDVVQFDYAYAIETGMI